MNLSPLGERIIVGPITEEETTASGLFIPQNTKEKPSKGRVLAVGSQITDVKVGDMVLFGKYAGSEIKVNGQDVLIMYMDDVMCIIE